MGASSVVREGSRPSVKRPCRGRKTPVMRLKRLGLRVLGARAALGRGEPAALRGDRAALDAVRGRHVHDDLARVLLADLVHVGRAEPRPTSAATSRGTRVSMRMWLGWSSRVLLPDAKTEESLSKVSLPSGDRVHFARSVVIRSARRRARASRPSAASSRTRRRHRRRARCRARSRFVNAGRMLRTRFRSFQTKLSCSESS